MELKTEENRMALLNDSFVSEVLLETLSKLQIPTYAQGGLKEKLAGRNIPLLELHEAEAMLKQGNCVVYSNAENFVPLLTSNWNDGGKVEAIKVFKNKFLFRKMLLEFYPDFYFKQIKLSDADVFKPVNGRKLILKPSVGFLSLGVKQFSSENEFKQSMVEAVGEISKYRTAFDSSILDESFFLIEDKVEGGEFACDAYFDENGSAVVLGIYCHAFRDENDFRDVVYYTGKKTVEEQLPLVRDFLEKLSRKIALKRFPIHFEFRVDSNGSLIPMEVNPMRFGGFGLADLPFYCFGINPYEYFLENKKPDWTKILGESNGNYHAFVLGRMEGVETPDVDKFKKTFGKLSAFVPLDYKKFPVFCTAYPESGDLNEILKYVYYDFSSYNSTV
ncbi:TPA: ATP-grasp domain-containing protein [Candidatus Micrarchaeota archaeon]|nr:ATP-grasp domain-containing protein [Candidatus Micrarchaeota archaeon]